MAKRIRTMAVLAMLGIALSAYGAEGPGELMGGGLLGIGLQTAPILPAAGARGGEDAPPQTTWTAACSRARPSSYRPPRVQPPPAATRALIAQLVAKHGLRGIDGSLTTVAKLRRMDAVFSKFPPACFKNLRISFERDPRWSGYWCPVDNAGNDIGWDNDPADQAPIFAGGHIYYYNNTVTRWIFTHELAHHVTIYADPALGRDLLKAFGQRITSPADDREMSRKLNFMDDWFPEHAPAVMYPTPYARNHPQEHWADLIAYKYEHPDREYDETIHRSFRMPPLVNALIQGSFGGAPSE